MANLTDQRSIPDGSVLPFPPSPSGSVAGRTLAESTYAPSRRRNDSRTMRQMS